jgi:hypothetical protein
MFEMRTSRSRDPGRGPGFSFCAGKCIGKPAKLEGKQDLSAPLSSPKMEEQPDDLKTTPKLPADLTVAAHYQLDAFEGRNSTVLVLDNFFTEQQRKGILDHLTKVNYKGWMPPADKWERKTADGPGLQPTMGLKDEWLDTLPAQVDIQAIRHQLEALYPEYDILSQPPNSEFLPANYPLQPEHTCAEFVANAALHDDNFRWHMDADPAGFPETSRWVQLHGSYPNRTPGKPLFVTLLLYLDYFWPRSFDAETLFLDDDTETGIFVRPKKYRAVLMDMDVWHRLSAPSRKAQRPRYSLVRKLLFCPPLLTAKGTSVPMTLSQPRFGPPVKVGSASGYPRKLLATPCKKRKQPLVGAAASSSTAQQQKKRRV